MKKVFGSKFIKQFQKKKPKDKEYDKKYDNKSIKSLKTVKSHKPGPTPRSSRSRTATPEKSRRIPSARSDRSPPSSIRTTTPPSTAATVAVHPKYPDFRNSTNRSTGRASIELHIASEQRPVEYSLSPNASTQRRESTRRASTSRESGISTFKKVSVYEQPDAPSYPKSSHLDPREKSVGTARGHFTGFPASKLDLDKVAFDDSASESVEPFPRAGILNKPLNKPQTIPPEVEVGRVLGEVPVKPNKHVTIRGQSHDDAGLNVSASVERSKVPYSLSQHKKMVEKAEHTAGYLSVHTDASSMDSTKTKKSMDSTKTKKGNLFSRMKDKLHLTKHEDSGSQEQYDMENHLPIDKEEDPRPEYIRPNLVDRCSKYDVEIEGIQNLSFSIFQSSAMARMKERLSQPIDIDTDDWTDNLCEKTREKFPGYGQCDMLKERTDKLTVSMNVTKKINQRDDLFRNICSEATHKQQAIRYRQRLKNKEHKISNSLENIGFLGRKLEIHDDISNINIPSIRGRPELINSCYGYMSYFDKEAVTTIPDLPSNTSTSTYHDELTYSQVQSDMLHQYGSSPTPSDTTNTYNTQISSISSGSVVNEGVMTLIHQRQRERSVARVHQLLGTTNF